MTRQQREDIVRTFWAANQGRHGATEGARLIADQYDIPVNTVRGLQNKMFPPDARPWNLPVRAPVHVCPCCNTTAAYNQDDIVRDFGPRMVWRGTAENRRQVQSHQSFCRTCRVVRRRQTRSKTRTDSE